jgi:flagellar basal body-associated protein FliL
MFLKSIGVASLTLAAIFLTLASAETMQYESTMAQSSREAKLMLQIEQLQQRLQQVESQVCRRPILPDFTGDYLELPAFAVNLKDAAGVTSLQVAVTIECQPITKPEQSLALEQAVPRLQDWLISHLADRTALDLLGSEAQEKIRAAIHEQLNNAIADPTLVQRVLFREFRLLVPTATTASTVLR